MGYLSRIDKDIKKTRLRLAESNWKKSVANAFNRARRSAEVVSCWINPTDRLRTRCTCPVYAAAGKGIEEAGKGGHERLAFTDFHFGDYPSCSTMQPISCTSKW